MKLSTLYFYFQYFLKYDDDSNGHFPDEKFSDVRLRLPFLKQPPGYSRKECSELCQITERERCRLGLLIAQSIVGSVTSLQNR